MSETRPTPDTWLIFDAARRGSEPSFWSLILVVLWANLHGSVPISLLIAGAAFLDYLDRSGFKDIATLKLWVLFLVLCPIVALINPYFYRPYVIAFELAQGIDVMGQISEWLPFTASGNRTMELGLLAILFPIIWSRARFSFGQVIFVIGALHMMLDHLRFQYVFFLLVPLVVMPEIVEALPILSMSQWQNKQRDRLETLLSLNRNLIIGGALAVCMVFATVLSVQNKVAPPESSSISSALAFVENNSSTHPALRMKVFNEYNFGGPLIMNNIKTYIDGRAEQLFLGTFMTNYLASGAPDDLSAMAKILEDTDIGWTIFPPQDPRNASLSKLADWHKTYEDQYAMIYERKIRN